MTADAGGRVRAPKGLIRRQLAEPLERNAYALALNALVTAALGLGYWILATRYYGSEQVGQNAALISALVLLSTCSQLNLGSAMTHFLPRAGAASSRLVASGYAASAALAAVLATTFVLVAPQLLPKLAFFQDSWLLSLGFCLAVVLWGIFAIQDGVLTGLRRAEWVPLENTGFGLAKLGLVVALAGALPAFGIFASWTLPLIVLLALVNLLVFRRLMPRHVAITAARAIPLRPRRIWRFVGGDYLGSLFLQGGTTLLPVLVAASLGTEANAHFYVAFILVSAVDVMAMNVGASLTVEGSHDEVPLAALIGRTAKLGAALLLPVAAALALAAPLVLSVFGDGYADAADTTLRLLALGVAAKGVTILYVSACRARGRVATILMVEAATFVLTLGLSLLLVGPYGISGVGAAWLASQATVAIAVFPRLRRLARTKY